MLYEGYAVLGTNHEEDDILFLADNPKAKPCAHDQPPLAQRLKWDMEKHGNYLSVQYFIAAKKCSLESCKRGMLQLLTGNGNAEYFMKFSDITGYLWTTEDLMVGGHDLLRELKSYAGKYVYLDVMFSKEAPKDEP